MSLPMKGDNVSRFLHDANVDDHPGLNPEYGWEDKHVVCRVGPPDAREKFKWVPNGRRWERVVATAEPLAAVTASGANPYDADDAIAYWRVSHDELLDECLQQRSTLRAVRDLVFGDAEMSQDEVLRNIRQLVGRK